MSSIAIEATTRNANEYTHQIVTHNAQARFAAPDQGQLGRFLSLLYGVGPGGYFELFAIDGDPDNKSARKIQTWHAYQGITQAVAIISRCIQDFGNVYVSRCRYEQPQRAAMPLPSRAIFLDDIPPGQDLRPSAIVQTSKGSYQGYYLADTELGPEAYRTLARAAAAASGADRSGSDVQQLVRPPGSVNRKHGKGGYISRFRALVDNPYTLADLRQVWPAVDLAAAGGAAAGGAADPEAVYWLDNLHLLLDHEGIPRRFGPATFARKVLMGNSELEGDTSRKRYAVINGMVLCGYPDPEIMAMALHMADMGAGERKGRQWLENDIARIIVKCRIAHPDQRINPTRGSGGTGERITYNPAPEQPRRRGRANKLTPEQYRAWLTAHTDCGRVVLSQYEIASALGVSPSTVRRAESVLASEGVIRRVVWANRHGSHVIFCDDLRCVKNTQTPPESVAAADIFDAPSESQESSSESHGKPSSRVCVRVRTHPPSVHGGLGGGAAASDTTAAVAPPTVAAASDTTAAVAPPTVAQSPDSYPNGAGAGKRGGCVPSASAGYVLDFGYAAGYQAMGTDELRHEIETLRQRRRAMTPRQRRYFGKDCALRLASAESVLAARTSEAAGQMFGVLTDERETKARTEKLTRTAAAGGEIPSGKSGLAGAGLAHEATASVPPKRLTRGRMIKNTLENPKVYTSEPGYPGDVEMVRTLLIDGLPEGWAWDNRVSYRLVSAWGAITSVDVDRERLILEAIALTFGWSAARTYRAYSHL